MQVDHQHFAYLREDSFGINTNTSDVESNNAHTRRIQHETMKSHEVTVMNYNYQFLTQVLGKVSDQTIGVQSRGKGNR